MAIIVFKFILLIHINAVFLPGLISAFTIEEAVNLVLTNNLNLKKQQMNEKISENDLAEEKSQNFLVE